MGRSKGSKNKTKIIDNKKQRKVKLEPINPETVEVLEEPSLAFCKACKNSDLRKIKDTLNMVIITLQMVITSLDMEFGDIKSVCAKLRKWANDKVNMNRQLILRNMKKEDKE